ncbi:MAG: hypothetical protein LBN24_09500 [Mediterranea sp.]|jgi:hypothetical protein|nr:hypothetical protein [Mediterranea sp.]
MELAKSKLEQLITAVDRIVDSRRQNDGDLFGHNTASEEISKTLGIPLQDPDKSYNLYYGNIQKFMNDFLPKDNDITKPIRNLVSTLLSHHEKDKVKYGVRGGDSRMASTEDMEHIIDVLSDWSETPQDYLKLAYILIQKNKELGYIPEERTIQDYV